jgi:hypothetical protein
MNHYNPIVNDQKGVLFYSTVKYDDLSGYVLGFCCINRTYVLNFKCLSLKNVVTCRMKDEC